MSMERNYAVRITVHENGEGRLFGFVSFGDEGNKFTAPYVELRRVEDKLAFVPHTSSKGVNGGVYFINQDRHRVQFTHEKDVQNLLDFVGQYSEMNSNESGLCWVDRRMVTACDHNLPSQRGIARKVQSIRKRKETPVVKVDTSDLKVTFNEPAKETSLVGMLEEAIKRAEVMVRELEKQRLELVDKLDEVEKKQKQLYLNINTFRSAVDVAKETGV